MFVELASNWPVGFHSIFDVTNFMPIVPNLWDKQALHTPHTNDIKIKKADVLLGYMILFWAMLYVMYEKCLNSLLRRMRIPLMQRSRLIEAVWCCGFCFGSICYLKSPTVRILNFSSKEREVTHEELGVLLHKSFYFHRAGVEILCHGAWKKGLANLLFASFAMNPYQEKWCTVVSTFLFYKAIDTVVINLCRILMCVSHITGRKLPKLFFGLHCLNWIYLYVLFVPKLMLWPDKTDHIKADLGLWLWFAAECFDSIWLRLVGCARSTHWLEICLFPPPTKEAIELASIQKRHRDSMRKLIKRVPKKTEMWQTLLCVMAIKKKIKRMRESKQSDSDSPTDSTDSESPGIEITELNEEEGNSESKHLQS